MRPSPFQRMNNATWLVLLLLAFAVVYLAAFTPVYVEGDDAASIAYHVLGRQSSIQEPYAPYHGMMDVLLSPLPAQEVALRTFSIVISALATLCMIALIMLLVFNWLDRPTPAQKLLIVAVALAASPEYFYMGLVFSPVSIAMCFILSSHLLIQRIASEGPPPDGSRLRRGGLALLSAVLFGVGVAFRWTTVVYGAVIVTDLLIAGGRSTGTVTPMGRRLRSSVAWGATTLVMTLLAVGATGYGPGAAADSLRIGGRVISQDYRAGVPDLSDLILTGATLLPMLSPAFVLLGIVGFVGFLRDRDALLFVVVVGLLGASPWLVSGIPKFIITAIPGMALLVAKGTLIVWDGFNRARLKVVLRLALLLLLAVPWIIGVRLTRGDSSWGPGFEIRAFDRAEDGGGSPSIAVGAGAAFPTFEGPRAVFGHGFVLLGSEWKAMMDAQAEERSRLVEQALDLDAPIMVTNWSPSYYTNELAARGYTTLDSEDKISSTNGAFTERRFTSRDGDPVTVLAYEIQGEGTTEYLKLIAGVPGDFVALSANSGVLRDFYLQAPQAFEVVGVRSAIVDLESLNTALSEE